MAGHKILVVSPTAGEFDFLGPVLENTMITLPASWTAEQVKQFDHRAAASAAASAAQDHQDAKDEGKEKELDEEDDHDVHESRGEGFGSDDEQDEMLVGSLPRVAAVRKELVAQAQAQAQAQARAQPRESSNRDRPLKVFIVTGTTPMAKRAMIYDEFDGWLGPAVLLTTFQTSGRGMNFTGGHPGLVGVDTIVAIRSPWGPADIAQAFCRADRPRQVRPVVHLEMRVCKPSRLGTLDPVLCAAQPVAMQAAMTKICLWKSFAAAQLMEGAAGSFSSQRRDAGRQSQSDSRELLLGNLNLAVQRQNADAEKASEKASEKSSVLVDSMAELDKENRLSSTRESDRAKQALLVTREARNARNAQNAQNEAKNDAQSSGGEEETSTYVHSQFLDPTLLKVAIEALKHRPEAMKVRAWFDVLHVFLTAYICRVSWWLVIC